MPTTRITTTRPILDDPSWVDVGAQESVARLASSLREYVEYLQTTGVDGFPRRSEAERRRQNPRVAEGASPFAPGPDAVVPASRALGATAGRRSAPPRPGNLFTTGAERAPTLAQLRTEIGDCRRCKLCGGRTTIVFGVGNPAAELMFVGEGPGRDEDRQGEPFVGRAGQLLTEIITRGMKLRRQDVYIANVIKCRPPENRNPEPDEIAACEPFLHRQIELVRPRVLVALGKFAAQTLLRTTLPISKLRGVWHDYEGIKFMPTLHPAYLLRNPNDKRLVWQDVKLVMAALGMGG